MTLESAQETAERLEEKAKEGVYASRNDAHVKPASSSVLLALAERCEKEAPSRILDAEIELATLPGSSRKSPFGGFVEPGIMWKANGAGYSAPYYTTSLDAAVTLVPEGWNWSLEHNVGGPCGAEVSKLDGRFLVSADTERFGNAKSPALALCAAALRARAAMAEDAAGPT